MSDQVGAPAVPKKRLGTGAVIGLVLALGVVAGVGGTWLRGTDSDSGPTYPTSWDPRVAKLASYVEAHRGLTFKHPVYVEFLSDAEFVKQVTSDGSDLSASDKKDLANEQAFMRALGLISGKTDLFKANNDLNGSDIVGLYNFHDKKIRVRGDHLTPSIRVTLVHEMTHVLQDQYFDLNGTYKRLEADKTADSYAFHAIVEGDAVRIQDGYQSSLSAADRAAIAKGYAKDFARSAKGSASVPQFMQALSGAPYALGAFAAKTAFAKGGNAAVDQLFEHPPLHDSLIVDPFLIDRALPLPALPELKLRTGEKEVDRGSLGSFPLFLMIAKNTPYARAMMVAEGDLNDRYVQYSVGSTNCVRAEFAARGAAWATDLADALRVWSQHSHTSATVAQSGVVITINSCDPGPSYVAVADHSNDALHVLTERSAVYSLLRGDRVPAGFSICYANGVINRFSLRDLERLDRGENTAADKAIEHEVAVACRDGKV